MKDPEITTFVITYCSRDKDPSPEPLPAVDRYLSSRVRAAREAAFKLQLEFRILSGLYGLLEQDKKIPDYDHLLTPDQVPDHAEKLAGQLAASNAGRVVFITRSLAEDPGTEPYRQAMLQACSIARVECGILEIKPGEPSVSDLIAKIWGPGR